MLAASIYVLLCVAGLPFWVAQQHLGGRSVPLIFASCGYAAYSVLFGAQWPMDGLTLAVGCVAAWFCASMIWTDTHKSLFEVFTWLSYLVLFTAARQVPPAVVCVGLLISAVIVAAWQAWFLLVKKEKDPVFHYAIFGNGNHTGCFMLISIFACLWLSVHVSLWSLCALPVVVFALITSKCKGAILGAVIGGLLAGYVAGFWIESSACLIIIAGLAILSLDRVTESFMGRSCLYKAAIEMIRKRPLTGWGLNSFGKELPETEAVRTAQAGENKRSHRVHNDFLEIMVETGPFGLFLLVYLFSGLSYGPVILGLLAAFAVHACFFFPLREVHTAAPFWAIMGATSAAHTLPVSSLWLIKATIVAILVAVAIKTAKVFLGQWYSCKAEYKPGLTDEQKRACYGIALRHDPLDGGYLPDAAKLVFKTDPIGAFVMMATAYVNYDGTRMKHHICDMFARTIINAKESNICHWLEDRSLALEEDNDSAVTVKNFLFMRDAKK